LEEMMEFRDTVLKRRIVRNFRPDPVAPETLERMVGLAMRAPSAGFSQGQAFVIVTEPDLRAALAALCGESGYVRGGFHPFLSAAPALIVACTSEEAYHRRYRAADKLRPDGTEIDWPVPYWHMDIGCAVMILLLAVVDEGLAAGFVGVTDPDGVRALLTIPAEYQPVGVIPVGYAAPDVPSPSLRRGRAPRERVIHHERWQSVVSEQSDE
jgi:nitroreductase